MVTTGISVLADTGKFEIWAAQLGHLMMWIIEPSWDQIASRSTGGGL
jgi:hypothetical protein